MVTVQPGSSDGKVILKLPHLEEFEISPHEIEEWLSTHRFTPSDHQRRELDDAVTASIERARQRLAAAGQPAAPTHDSHLVDLWASFHQSSQHLKGVAGSQDRSELFRSITETLDLMRQIEEWSQGGRSWSAELESWARHGGEANTWTLESIQHAAWGLGEYGENVGGWARSHLDPRHDEVIMSQHQFHDYSGQVRQSLAPVQTWATESP